MYAGPNPQTDDSQYHHERPEACRFDWFFNQIPSNDDQLVGTYDSTLFVTGSPFKQGHGFTLIDMFNQIVGSAMARRSEKPVSDLCAKKSITRV